MAEGLDPRDDALERRLDRMLAAEGLDRMRLAAVAMTLSLLVIAPLLAVITGWPEAIYYHGLLAVFCLSVWGQYFAARRWPEADGIDYAFVAFNFSLLSFTLIYPNPLTTFGDYPFAPAVQLRQGNYIYFFLILVLLGFSFSARLVLWGGVCAAVSWSLARLWAVGRPGIELFDEADDFSSPEAVHEFMLRALAPNRVDPGVWIQEVVVILVVAAILAQVVRGSRRLLLRRAMEERRRANLSRYLPRQMADRMAEADQPFLEDREAEAAVMFTDVVGFTGWAEAHPPAEVVALLREVHGMVAEEVFRADGVLDKFIGDGAMATFGIAGVERAADCAIDCAEAILRRAAAYNAARAARGAEPVRLSVGVHFGPVTIGDVGAAERMEMSVVGDSVNVASRLEALNRRLDSGAVVSDALMQSAGGPRPGWTARGPTALPGRTGAVSVWTRPLEPGDPARPDADDPGRGASDHGDANRPSAAAG